MKLLAQCCLNGECLKDTYSLSEQIQEINHWEPLYYTGAYCLQCKLPSTIVPQSFMATEWRNNVQDGIKNGFKHYVVPNSRCNTEGMA